jgi:hypothetical protein
VAFAIFSVPGRLGGDRKQSLAFYNKLSDFRFISVVFFPLTGMPKVAPQQSLAFLHYNTPLK